MTQLQLFSRSEVAAMRDRSRSRNYSAEGEEFRRAHARHRSWGLARRHARKLCRLHGRSAECSAVGLHESADVPPLIWPAGATRERPPSESAESRDATAKRAQPPDRRHRDDRTAPADQPTPTTRAEAFVPPESAEPAERTGPANRRAPTEETRPPKRTQLGERTEPRERTDSAEPTELAERTRPTEPTRPPKHTQPGEHTELGERTGPAKRSDSAQHTVSIEGSWPPQRSGPRLARGSRPTATCPTAAGAGTPRMPRPRHGRRNPRSQADNPATATRKVRDPRRVAERKMHPRRGPPGRARRFLGE